MKLLFLCLFLLSPLLMAQDDAAPPAEETTTDAAADETATENEEQKNTRVVSLRDLEEADERINQEREQYAKTERRIKMLLEDLGNQAQTIESKENTIRKLLEDKQKGEGVDKVPPEQIAHWNSRNPKSAAGDFVLLYEKSPAVAVNIIKGMKKKKSAKLMDEVAALGKNGQEVASELQAAIGTGTIKEN